MIQMNENSISRCLFLRQIQIICVNLLEGTHFIYLKLLNCGKFDLKEWKFYMLGLLITKKIMFRTASLEYLCGSKGHSDHPD